MCCLQKLTLLVHRFVCAFFATEGTKCDSKSESKSSMQETLYRKEANRDLVERAFTLHQTSF